MTAYRCPACIGQLSEALHCAHCNVTYPVRDEIADFSGGRYYDQFDETTVLTDEHRQALEREMEGAVARIRDYYLPKIGARPLRVLDAGLRQRRLGRPAPRRRPRRLRYRSLRAAPLAVARAQASRSPRGSRRRAPAVRERLLRRHPLLRRARARRRRGARR